jgi:4'-phosphopantetheinyl transferase
MDMKSDWTSCGERRSHFLVEPRHTIAMPESPSCADRDEVRAWHAHIDHALGDPAAVAHARQSLTDVEQARFERYHGDADRRMFLLGRVMSRGLVGRALNVGAGGWEWREGPHGRPEIAQPTTPVRFNLAHSAGLVVCAIASGRDVGVDVEDLQRPAIDPAMVNRYCAPAEAADIEAQGDRWRDRFLVYWTLKEAYLKARGLGISVPLRDICFVLQPPPVRVTFLGSLAGTPSAWTFHLSQPTDRHLVAIAASAEDGVEPRVLISSYRVHRAGTMEGMEDMEKDL